VQPEEEVKAAEVVADALRQLGPRLRETGARVKVADDLPLLRADRRWAVQAVYNLMSNALKFTNPGKPPEVEVAAYQPAAGEPAGQGIVVRDRGLGVAPEHAKRIFEMFQRAVGQEVEGTGAGLAIVRQVAERHGCTAWVRPRDGGGSEFIITFGPGGRP
jgi:signal transduction histidine kinase